MRLAASCCEAIIGARIIMLVHVDGKQNEQQHVLRPAAVMSARASCCLLGLLPVAGTERATPFSSARTATAVLTRCAAGRLPHPCKKFANGDLRSMTRLCIGSLQCSRLGIDHCVSSTNLQFSAGSQAGAFGDQTAPLAASAVPC